ncbi:MAG: hypothetical protein KKF27_20665 [Gammaproteobacteria bacterium]|nr:hypothetical protein [Gammaproteobacteria bacterium]
MTEENALELSEDPKHSIVLKKQAKGYGWDIKLYFDEEGKSTVVDELEGLNNLMREKFRD